MDPVREAEAVFRKHDDGFRFAEYPVEIRVLGEMHMARRAPGESNHDR